MFFFIYSFRSWIEAHWVAFAIIPLAVVLFDMCILYPKIFKKLQYALLLSMVLILTLRLSLIFDFIPIKTEFNSQKAAYFKAIKRFAQDRRVIFINSYQNASKYTFYTGENSHSVNDIYYRKNQYDLWRFDADVKNQGVLVVGSRSSGYKDSVLLNTGTYLKYKIINNFKPLGQLKGTIINPPLTLENKAKGSLKLKIRNPYDYNFLLTKKNHPYQIALNFEQDNKNHIVQVSVDRNQMIEANRETAINMAYQLKNLDPGKYKMSLIIKDDFLYFIRISDTYEVEVKNSTLFH
ncbi:MAG: hypothetical protein L3J45_10075 [Flavobacteriaceae bacterium]|nr:hypothetical protein [Flavobacteriaceae bacterium]